MSAMLMEQERELTLEEVAEYLHLSLFTVRRRVSDGKIRARREGREYRVKESDLEAYIRSTYKDKSSE